MNTPPLFDLDYTDVYITSNEFTEWQGDGFVPVNKYVSVKEILEKLKYTQKLFTDLHEFYIEQLEKYKQLKDSIATQENNKRRRCDCNYHEEYYD